MSVVIFVLLSSQDGFSRDWVVDDKGHRTAPAIYNGAFSTIAFLLGAVTSILSGYLGMKIAVYANARTSLEARKGIAPAFMCGKYNYPFLELVLRLNSCLQHECLQRRHELKCTYGVC